MARPPRIWSASWRVMGCPAKCRRARATAFCPDVEPVHDRLDVDVLNLNVRADLGHTPITNHQSPITNHQSPITNHAKNARRRVLPLDVKLLSPRAPSSDIAWRCRCDGCPLRDVPDHVVAGIDARSSRLGLSRSEYLRRRLAREG